MRAPNSPIRAPAGRPCVDCHAFEFMQRALQDLRKTAYSLDARVSPRPQVGGGRDQPVSPCPALASCRPYLACYTMDIPAYVSALSTPFKCPAHCFQTPSRWTLPCDPQPGPEDASPNPAVPTWDDKVQQAERKLREGGELLLFSGSGRSVGQGRSAWEGQSLGRAGCLAWARGIPPNRE